MSWLCIVDIYTVDCLDTDTDISTVDGQQNLNLKVFQLLL